MVGFGGICGKHQLEVADGFKNSSSSMTLPSLPWESTHGLRCGWCVLKQQPARGALKVKRGGRPCLRFCSFLRTKNQTNPPQEGFVSTEPPPKTSFSIFGRALAFIFHGSHQGVLWPNGSSGSCHEHARCIALSNREARAHSGPVWPNIFQSKRRFMSFGQRLNVPPLG